LIGVSFSRQAFHSSAHLINRNGQRFNHRQRGLGDITALCNQGGSALSLFSRQLNVVRTANQLFPGETADGLELIVAVKYLFYIVRSNILTIFF